MELGARHGWPLTEADVIELFIGRSNDSVMHHIIERVGDERARLWRDEYMPMHITAVDAGLVPVPGIIEALDAITVATCVASGGTHDKMRHTLGVSGLYTRFDGRIFSASEVDRGKPAPDLFLHAAERMGVPPERCVVVEDSRPGVQAARAAGMRSFGYAGGVTPAAWLEGPGTTVFTDMRHLPELLAARPSI